MLGVDRVGSPRTADGHRPARYAIASYAPPPPPSFALAPKSGRGLLSVRVLRPPVPLEVILEDLSASPRPRVPASAPPPLPPSPPPSLRSNASLRLTGPPPPRSPPLP